MGPKSFLIGPEIFPNRAWRRRWRGSRASRGGRGGAWRRRGTLTLTPDTEEQSIYIVPRPGPVTAAVYSPLNPLRSVSAAQPCNCEFFDVSNLGHYQLSSPALGSSAAPPGLPHAFDKLFTRCPGSGLAHNLGSIWSRVLVMAWRPEVQLGLLFVLRRDRYYFTTG